MQKIPDKYKSEKPVNITGVDKNHLNCDCIKRSIVDSLQEPILYSFVLKYPPGQEMYKEPRIKLFKEINKPVVSHITFYIKDDNHKAVDFNGETISFICQLIEI